MAIASGTPVKSGYYWNTRRWTFGHVAKDGEALRGGLEDRWARVPTPVVLAAAPILGGIFVVAFPFFGLAAVAQAVSRKLTGTVKDGATELAANLAPGPLPGESHLTGKPGEDARGGGATTPELERLERDVEAMRRK